MQGALEQSSSSTEASIQPLCFIHVIGYETNDQEKWKSPACSPAAHCEDSHRPAVPPISVLGSYCSQNLSGFQFSHFPLSGNSDEITFLPEAFSSVAEPYSALKEMHFSGTCFPTGGVGGGLTWLVPVPTALPTLIVDMPLRWSCCHLALLPPSPQESREEWLPSPNALSTIISNHCLLSGRGPFDHIPHFAKSGSQSCTYSWLSQSWKQADEQSPKLCPAAWVPALTPTSRHLVHPQLPPTTWPLAMQKWCSSIKAAGIQAPG